MAISKRAERLKQKAVATVRTPRPQTLLDSRAQKKGYRIIGISLYLPEAEWIDRTTTALQRAGNPKANRSLVIREAICRLQEELQGKAAEEILQDFIERQAKRTGQAYL